MRKFLVAGLFLVVVSASWSQTASPQLKQFIKIDAPVVALTHVRVIDGTGAAAREDQTVVISKGKIASVGDASSAAVPKDAQVLDLHGDTVIPGLVGMHDHMFYPMGNGVFGEMAYSFPRLYLAAGVTTIRTTGSLEPYTDLELKKSIDAGETPGPKMHVTGPYLEGKGSWAIADASTHRPGRCGQDREFLARPGRGQFQGVHVHHAGGVGCGDSGGAQAGSESYGTSLCCELSRSRRPRH